MNKVGQIERATQNRVLKLLQDQLGWRYLGNWEEREGNSNIEEDELQQFLSEVQGYDESLIKKALFELKRAAGDQSRSLYDVNRDVYSLLRYGVKVKTDVGEATQTVWLIDWKDPNKNRFAVAEEVTVSGEHDKRPDIVFYVNGIALGLLELKRSVVSVAEGIRQNLDSQKRMFIQRFFTTIQFVMAGNDTEGLRYGTIETREKYYLTWKQASDVENLLDRAIGQLCLKERFLELIHDFIVFDSGTKKLARHNQYFGVKAAQDHVRRREGGIIWHTQGSGKSLTMVWLAKWIRENVNGSRVLIITDRTELDEQIEGNFFGVQEEIYRTKSGADLVSVLNDSKPWLMCSLVHKFAGRDEADEESYIQELKRALPKGFRPRGDIYVFVDECHRTQTGVLHKAMKTLLPNAMFIGFTGTPLLKTEKQTSIEVFGRYIHTYRYDEAVTDKVVLDLQYEARDIDQKITSQEKIDLWFDAKTRGLNDLAKAQLKERWGTLRKVMSSQSRLEKIIADILMDMETRDRLMSGRGNAMLVSDSIYNACRFYEMFQKTDLASKCAIVTSYRPDTTDVKGEESGEGLTEKLRQYEIYNKMLNGRDVEAFEKDVKQKFIKEPGQMKLLIVVDKLLTGFNAPSATYLYIDKSMRDHGLFQAICRVNRLDDEDKTFGYIIDYKDLFKSLARSIHDYTSEAFDGFDTEDVAGLLTNRLTKGRQRLTEALEAVRALCEPVEPPKDSPAFLRYFCAADTADKEALSENEARRLALYKHVAELIRAFASIANEMPEAGYTDAEAHKIKMEIDFWEKVRTEVRMASGDYIDLKMYEPAMRHLIDSYIRAEESQKVSEFDDMSLVELIVDQGEAAIAKLPSGIRKNQEAIAETIENNVRRVIIDEQPANPKYYDKMSELLDALIAERRQKAISYAEFLKRIVELTRLVKNPTASREYPTSLNSAARRALFDNLGRNEALAVSLDESIRKTKKADWRGNLIKEREVRRAIAHHVASEQVDRVFELVKSQADY